MPLVQSALTLIGVIQHRLIKILYFKLKRCLTKKYNYKQFTSSMKFIYHAGNANKNIKHYPMICYVQINYKKNKYGFIQHTELK